MSTLLGYSEFHFKYGLPLFVFQYAKTDLSFERTVDSPLLYRQCMFNILLPGDVVVPKCPRSELLLEFTTLQPVRPWWCIRIRAGYVCLLYTSDAADE